MTRADLCVLGGGPGGIACARRSAELGARVVLVDPGDGRSSPALRGGLLQRRLARLVRTAGDVEGAALFETFRATRDGAVAEAVDQLVGGLERAGVRRVAARGRIDRLAPQPRIATDRGAIDAARLVLAVGARPARPTWAGPGSGVVPAEDLYGQDGPLPASLAVVGGGYLAVAAASLFRALGVDVVLVFADDEPLAGFDEELRRHVGGALQAAGVRLRPGTGVQAVTRGSTRRALETTAGVIAAEWIVAAGATAPVPNTDALDLGAHGVATTPGGAVYVDGRYASRVPGLFAIGDCADHAGQGFDPSTFDLGSIAEREGRALAASLFGAAPAPLDYERLPIAVAAPVAFAALGLGEARAAALGFTVEATRAETASGFVKLVACARSSTVLGCHLAGAAAPVVIEAVAAGLARDASLAALAARADLEAPLAQELVAQARRLG